MMIPHFYDFRVVNFKLPSRERLVKRLGEYDALAEFAVLSLGRATATEQTGC